jgi:hypothetical protein
LLPSIAPHLVIALPTFRKILYKKYNLVHGFFSYFFPYSYRSSNYCDSNTCRYFTLLKALAKSKGNLFAIAFKSDNYRYRDSWKSHNFRERAIKKETTN